MQSLVDTKVINKKINRFITIIAEKYDLDSMELMALWINNTDDMVEFSPAIAMYKKVKVEEMSVESVVDSSASSVQVSAQASMPSVAQPTVAGDKCADVSGKKRKSKKECSYVLLRGPKKGTMCGCTVKNPDNDFCPKHNGGGDDDDEKKVKKENPVDETPVIATTSTLLRKNKSIDKLWHESTGLVFESSTNRVVIGKCEGDEVKPLSQDDIAVCKQNGFKFLEKEAVVPEVIPASGAFANDWTVSNPDNNELKRIRKAEIAQKKTEPDSYADVITDVEHILHGLAQPAKERADVKKDDNVGMSYDLSDNEEEFLLEEEE